MASLVVRLDDSTEVTLFTDGSASVDLEAMRVARHDLRGHISVYADGSLKAWRAEDAIYSTPLPPHVIRAAENAARKQVSKARRVTREISRKHSARPKKGG